jgi:fatty acid desaturase
MQLFTLNAGFHVEHHILPKVPWYRLTEVHRILMEEAGGAPYSIDGFLAAHWSVLKAHFADAFGLGRSASI